MSALPGERYGRELRQRGGVVDRRGIPREQQVGSFVQEVAAVAIGSDEEPNEPRVAAGVEMWTPAVPQ